MERFLTPVVLVVLVMAFGSFLNNLGELRVILGLVAMAMLVVACAGTVVAIVCFGLALASETTHQISDDLSRIHME